MKPPERLLKITRLQAAIDAGRVRRTVFTDLLIRGHDEDFEPLPAEQSTDAICGSAEKVEVIRLRVERGECLWHRGDNREIVATERWVKSSAPGILVIPAIFSERKPLGV